LEKIHNMTKPVHSDFLIYWTGKRDIDEYERKIDKYDWRYDTSSKTNENTTKLYLERLTNILKHGLWMCRSQNSEEICINKKSYTKPSVARVCFTELRLSEVRKHAAKFGRLGIGFKRYFVFERMGSPLMYVQENTNNLFFPPFTDFFSEEREMLSFVKHMCPKGKTPQKYDLFDESEWRIIYSESIKGKLENSDMDDRKKQEILRSFKKINKINDKEFQDYVKKHDKEKRLEYLVPLDRWFSMIIYPSLAVKLESERSDIIRNLIEDIKPDLPKGERPSGDARDEIFSKPIELNLDACRNF